MALGEALGAEPESLAEAVFQAGDEVAVALAEVETVA